MAKIPGGITSRPSGKLGNIIFGAARTPEGKVATAREAVDPSNPNTPEQAAQRSKFRQALNVVQRIGPSIYQEDWNRSVGQLPGFQSWQSILLNNIDANDQLQPPPDRPLGSLHFPDSTSASAGSRAAEIDVTWSSETGPDGTPQDEVYLIAIESEQPSGRDRDVVTSEGQDLRSTGSITLGVSQASTDYVICLYLVGQAGADGLLSKATFSEASSG